MTALWVGAPGSPWAQNVAREADSTVRAPAGAEFRIPLGSLVVPGLGQYLRGAPVTGATLTATAVATFSLATDRSGTVASGTTEQLMLVVKPKAAAKG